MRVIGIDPGSAVTGYGIVEIGGGAIRHLDNGGIIPRRTDSHPRRLHEIFRGLTALIERHRPQVAVIENLFVAKNARSSLILGQARGAAILAAAAADLEIAEYAPSAVKQAIVGNGQASKRQVQCMVQALLGLPEIAMEDASDALAVAICHCHTAACTERIARATRGEEMRRRP